MPSNASNPKVYINFPTGQKCDKKKQIKKPLGIDTSKLSVRLRIGSSHYFECHH